MSALRRSSACSCGIIHSRSWHIRTVDSLQSHSAAKQLGTVYPPLEASQKESPTTAVLVYGRLKHTMALKMTWRNSCFSTDAAFQKHILHRRVVDGSGHVVSLPLRAVGIFLKCGIAFGLKKCIKCGNPARFEIRTSRGWTMYGWTCKQVGHKHMETQLNVFGFLTDIPVNSWLPFLHMINLLRLGRSFSSITDEILAGYGNIARQTLAKWRDVYPKALGCALTNLDARMIGGKHHVVVMDETVVGVHAEDGWTGGWRGINKAGAEQNRSSERRIQQDD